MIGLGGAEVIVRMWAPQQLSGRWRLLTDGGYFVNLPNAVARHRNRARDVSYRINSEGLRGGELTGEGARVLALGDSVTFGWLLDEQDTHVAVLQSEADRAIGRGHLQILNGGAGGWGTDDVLAWVEDRAEALAPRAILVFLSSRDIDRSWDDGLYELDAATASGVRRGTPHAKTTSGMRALTHVPGYDWLLHHSHLVQLARHALVRWHTLRVKRRGVASNSARLPASTSTDSPTATEADAAAGARIARAQAFGRGMFRRLNEWCAARDVRLFVVAINGAPGAEIHGAWGEEDATRAFKHIAPDVFAEADVPYRDLYDDIEAELGAPLSTQLIPGDHHPNERAARAVGLTAWRFLEPHLRDLAER